MADEEIEKMKYEHNFMWDEIIPRLSAAAEKTAESLQKLTAIDERQSEFRKAIERAFKTIQCGEERIDELEARVRALEIQMPVLNLIKKWVIGGVVGGMALFLLAAAVIIFKLPVH